VAEVLLEWFQDRGIEHPRRGRSLKEPHPPATALPVLVDRPGERIALRFRKAPLQVQVSDDVRRYWLHEHGACLLQ